jgi:hypothetical protein
LRVQNSLRKNELLMTDLLADAGCSIGANYHFLEQRKVTGWIPVFGKYEPNIEGFPYNKEKGEYRCQTNRPQPLKAFCTNRGGSVLKNYGGGTEGFQGLPHETLMCAEYQMQKDNRNDL